MVDTEVEQRALSRDARAVEDVELRLLEGRRHLVLDDLDARAIADRVGAALQRLDAPDVETDGGVELQRLAAGSGLRAAEEHTDLLAQLVDEDHRGLRLVQPTRELAERLRHQARLQTHVGVTHLALDLGTGHERGHRVDDDQVDRPRPDEHVGDLERLLTGVRLRDEQGVDVDTELLGVLRVERVLGVDEGRDATGALRVGDGVQGQGRLTRGLRAVDLDDAAARQPADAERDVEGDRTGRDGGDGGALVGAEAHDRALAELPVDLGESGLEGLLAVCR
ncbi:putative protein recA [Curtobacterium sp. ER1/6]|nr:putative protein recA [Curtobacterium sp. ER1/6]